MEDLEGDAPMPTVEAETPDVPLAPYVGMVFNMVEEAQEFYNDYAKKLGFGTIIGCSKKSQKKVVTI
jgi:hypothetical protein